MMMKLLWAVGAYFRFCWGHSRQDDQGGNVVSRQTLGTGKFLECRMATEGSFQLLPCH